MGLRPRGARGRSGCSRWRGTLRGCRRGVRSGCAAAGTGAARRSCARRPSASSRAQSRGRSSAKRSSPGCAGDGARRALRASGCAVAVQRPRPAPWPAPAPAHGRDLVDEWDQLGDVVAVAAGERAGKRRAAPAGDYVMLGAAPRAVDGAGAGLFAPPTPARASCRSPPATSRSARPPAASPARARAAAAKHPPAATPAADASR